MGDLGFSEAYMFGEVECEDLISTFLVSMFMAYMALKSNPLA